MVSAATALQSHQLVVTITEYQHGIHADMRPLLRAKNPLKELHRVDHADNVIDVVFASLDAAITAWYTEWGHARIFKLFACLPRMQLRVIAHALWSGNLSVLTLVPVEMLRQVPSRVVDFAALLHDKSSLQYLHEVVGLDVSTPGAMYNAATCGHLDVIRYLHQLNNDTDVQWAVMVAARRGHLETIEFFHVHCASCDLLTVFCSAIVRQDLVVAQFILDFVGKDNVDGPDAMVSAAVTGNVVGLEWLHQRGFACSTDAMDEAAGRGHLDVVQWLHANRSEGCTELAMHGAAANGYLEVVEWLFCNRHEGCTADTLEKTTSSRFWHVARFLVAHYIGTDDAQAALSFALKMKDVPADVIALFEAATIQTNGPQRKKHCI